MKDNTETVVMRGKLYYAKILGEPVPNYGGDGLEWKFEFVPNEPKAAKAQLKDLGVADRLRSKDTFLDGAPHLSFKQNALTKAGEPRKPIIVVDAAQNKWDESKLIGNETIADVKFVVIDNGKGKFHGVYPRSVRILEHIPYVPKVFDDLDENDAFYEKQKQAEEQKARDMALLTGTPLEGADDADAPAATLVDDDEIGF